MMTLGVLKELYGSISDMKHICIICLFQISCSCIYLEYRILLNNANRSFCIKSSYLIDIDQFLLVGYKSCRVRMHYGHPDVFDRIFHITRGGISKASRVINISEDIYSGE